MPFLRRMKAMLNEMGPIEMYVGDLYIRRRGLSHVRLDICMANTFIGPVQNQLWSPIASPEYAVHFLGHLYQEQGVYGRTAAVSIE